MSKNTNRKPHLNNDQKSEIVVPEVQTDIVLGPKTAVEEVVPEPPVPTTPAYTKEYLTTFFVNPNGRTGDLVARLSLYMGAVQNVKCTTELQAHAHYMDEILSLLNNMPTAEFVVSVQQFLTFIDADLTSFGNKSSMFSFNPHKPFFGSRPLSAVMLEMLRQAGPEETRVQVASLLERAPLLTNVFPNGKAAVFIAVLRGE